MEAKRKQDEEAKRKQEQEAKLKQEQEAKRKQDEVAQKKRDEEAKAKQKADEAEAKKKERLAMLGIGVDKKNPISGKDEPKAPDSTNPLKPSDMAFGTDKLR